VVETIIKDPTEYVITSELFNRYEKNPILTSAEWPYRANAVFNAGATRFKDETILRVRVFVKDLKTQDQLDREV